MQKARRFFLVSCKCGHVGRSNFIRMVFLVRAWDAREAAAIGRTRPWVKHDHPDAILDVWEVGRGEYLTAEKELRNDIYWHGARHNQGLLMDRLESDQRNAAGLKGFYNTITKKSDSRNFRLNKNKIIEAEIREYIEHEYRKAV